MLLPRKTKYRKVQKGRFGGKATSGTAIDFGHYGLQAVTSERITSRQIEAARRAMTRHIRRGGKVWIRIFPHLPVTKKPNEVPMGGGKGNPEFFITKVKAGMIIFELDGVEEELAREAMRRAAHKLPVRTRILVRPTIGEET